MTVDQRNADYQDKTVVITGGSTGVGLATARRLAQGGARVMITGRSQDTLDAAVEELGVAVVGVRSDTASNADIQALVAAARERFDRIDLLFVNAGITRFVGVGDVTEADYDEVFAVNTRGAYFTVQAFVPLLRDGGAIVLTTSVAGVKGLAMSSVYAASKAAVRSFTRSFARELQPRGIRVNAVSPGPVDTGILERALPGPAADAARAQMTASNPMGRFGSPDEVARTVLHLAFEATYTTGAEFAVDGGAAQL